MEVDANCKKKAFLTVPVGMRYDSASFHSNLFKYCREDCNQGKKFKHGYDMGVSELIRIMVIVAFRSQHQKRKVVVLRLEDTQLIFKIMSTILVTIILLLLISLEQCYWRLVV